MFDAAAPRRLALLLLAAAALAPAALEAQQWRSVTSSRQLWDERRLDVEMEYAAGRLEVAPGSPTLLYQLEMRYDEEQFRPVTEYRRESGVLRLGLRSRDGSRNTRVNRISDQSRAQLRLNPTIPTRLNLAFAAGEADVDVGGLSLLDLRIGVGASQARVHFDTPNRIEAERVRIEAGAADLQVTGLGNARAERIEVAGGVGNVVLDFGGAWERNAQVSIDMGVGAVTLRVPRSVGLSVTRSTFLTRFEHGGMVRRGNAHFSTNYDSTTHRLTVNVNAAMGAISVEWVD